MRGSIMPSGKVKWFNSSKGYGFITDDDTNKDIFLHVSALEESKLRVLKRKLQKEGFFKIMKMKSTHEKPSERKKSYNRKYKTNKKTPKIKK